MKGKYFLLFITFSYLIRKVAQSLVWSLLSMVVVSVKMQIREAEAGPNCMGEEKKFEAIGKQGKRRNLEDAPESWEKFGT